MPLLHCSNSVTPRVPRRCISVLCLMNRLSGIDFEHRNQSNSNLFYLFKHVSQYNAAIRQIRSPNRGKTGNPAGLLFRRIWYSVGKSGVLGITEYRQGRPLVCKINERRSSLVRTQPHTMRFSAFRPLCVRQKTKIAWT